MPRNVLHLLIPLALLVVLFPTVFREKSSEILPEQKSAKLDVVEFDPSRFLIRPFYAKDQQTALALDGGEIPAANGQVPSIVVGKNILRTVHLAWVHDWSQPECRAVFHKLADIYASEQGEMLPALRIYLNPVFSDAEGEGIHRALLQVYFRSRKRENFVVLASELAGGALETNPMAIRKRVEELDPTIISDWSVSLDWLENDMAHTFSVAKAQQTRNAIRVGNSGATQLTSLLQVLPPQSDRQQIIDFLTDADSAQRAWLQTQRPN